MVVTPLTRGIYYTINNRYLTSSRIKDFLKDPYYFYQKHIKGIIHEDQTPSMLVGGAVDCILTEGMKVFQKRYMIVSRRNLKEPPKKYTEISQGDYDKVIRISQAVSNTSIYKDIIKQKYVSQKIIHTYHEIGNFFCGMAGIPDWYKVSDDGKQAIIIDLKTTSSVEIHRFKYICIDYQYYLQQAFYQELVKSVHPTVESVKSYLLAVENDEHLNRVKLFELNQQTIEVEKQTILEAIDKISKIEDYQPSDVKWEDAEII